MPKPQIRSNKLCYLNPIEKRLLSRYTLLLGLILLATLGVFQHRYWHKQLEFVAQKATLETQKIFTEAIHEHLHTSDSVANQQLLLSWEEADLLIVEVNGVKSLRIRPHP